MDLSRPYSGIASTVEGDVLVALAATTRPMTGRQVARVVRRGSQPAVNRALNRLAAHGLVNREPAPPAVLYSLNREHVGYAAVEALAGMRTELLRRLREQLVRWEIPAVHVSMFGSAARGDGAASSDVDLAVVRPRGVDEDDEQWQAQLGGLRDAVRSWSGNAASIVELGEETLANAAGADLPVLADWRRDAVQLAGRPLGEVLRETS
jgi:hypothetical protein